MVKYSLPTYGKWQIVYNISINIQQGYNFTI